MEHIANSKSKLTVYVLLGSTLAVLASGAWVYRLTSKQDHILPRQGPVIESVYGLGTVLTPQTFQVKTAVNQTVDEVFVKEGDTVKAGDRLISFDSITNRAPFEGTITGVSVKKGELLFPNVPALTLVNLNDLYLEVSLEQQTVLRVKKDQKAIVSFEGVRGERIESKVQSVYPRDSQFIVRIFLDQTPKGILPGMTADVAIEVGRKESVLSVPLRAVSGGKISLIRNGKVFKESIQVGVVDGEWAEVTSANIKPDDEILVRSK